MLQNREEGLTLALIFLAYAAWLILLRLGGDWPSVVTIFGLASVIAFHSSAQHEVIHGHPFKNQKLSDALVYLPIGLAIPFDRFRDLHLAHHNDAILTDPYDDPETNYLDPAIWSTLSKPKRALYRFNNTLIGRMLVGPAIGLASFYQQDFALIRGGDKNLLRVWVLHGIASLIVIMIVAGLGYSIGHYLLACYFGLSLLKIRTFAEHQAHERAAARSVVVEDRGPLALLFLNNCYHSVHHIHPKLPWYALPRKYRENREHYLHRNDHYVFKNYLALFKSYFWTRKDDVPHPLYEPRK